MTTRRTLGISALGATCIALFGVACNNGPRVTTISSTRFEVTTGSVVLGAKQLLVDTSNGDTWILEGERSAEPRWVLRARGPEDVREPIAKDLLAQAGGNDEASP